MSTRERKITRALETTDKDTIPIALAAMYSRYVGTLKKCVSAFNREKMHLEECLTDVNRYKEAASVKERLEHVYTECYGGCRLLLEQHDVDAETRQQATAVRQYIDMNKRACAEKYNAYIEAAGKEISKKTSLRTVSKAGTITSRQSSKSQRRQLAAEREKRIAEMQLEHLKRERSMERRENELRRKIILAEYNIEEQKIKSRETDDSLSEEYGEILRAYRDENAPEEEDEGADIQETETLMYPEKRHDAKEELPMTSGEEIHLESPDERCHEKTTERKKVIEPHGSDSLQSSKFVYKFHLSDVWGANLPEFDGKSINYKMFEQRLDTIIESYCVPDKMKIDVLMKCLKGSAYRAVESCLMKPSVEGYESARETLHTRYGQKHMITRAYIKELTGGPPLRAKVDSDLFDLLTCMQNAQTALTTLEVASELDTDTTLQKIYARLPRRLREDYDEKANLIFDSGRRPCFNDLLKFVSRRTLRRTNIYGQVNSELDKTDKPMVGKKPRVSAFNTNASSTNNLSESVANLRVTDNSQNESQEKPYVCPMCDPDRHRIWNCRKFLGMNPFERAKWVGENSLCYNCLQGNHTVTSCTRAPGCREVGCRRNHHSLLHFPPKTENQERERGARPKEYNVNNRVPPKGERVNGNVRTGASNGAGSSRRVNVNNNSCMRPRARMPVLPVLVHGEGGAKAMCYAVLDSASDVTVIRNDLASQLNLFGRRIEYSMETMTDENSSCTGWEVSLHIEGDENSVVVENALAVDKLPNLQSSVPTKRDMELYPHFKNAKLHDIPDKDVKLLIGVDCPDAFELFEVYRGGAGEPRVAKTTLGWCLFGPDKNRVLNDAHVNFVHCDNVLLHEEMVKVFDRDFAGDGPSTDTAMSIDDKRALSIYERTTRKVDGHYEVGLPWVSDSVKMPFNRRAVAGQLSCLRRKFLRDGEYFEKYNKVMNQDLENGYARRLPNEAAEKTRISFYIAHHSTTQSKFRVVFNGAGKYNGVSLNQMLLQGPNFLCNMLGVILRWRQFQVVVKADLKKMFYQIRLREEDRDAMRFLFYPSGNLEKEPVDYQMNVHIFGGKSSPSVAGYVLRRCITENEPGVDDKVVEHALRSFYVDDLLTGADNASEALRIVREIDKLTSSGGFHLTKYVSNSREVMQQIPEKDRAASVMNLDLEDDVPERTLGVTWNTVSDTLVTKIGSWKESNTRRAVLSNLSSIFDIVGYLQPFVITIKKLMQNLCKMGVGWDDELPQSEQVYYESWKRDLHNLEKLSIPRSYIPPGFGGVVRRELHIFCDASETAYAAVCYLRVLNSEGRVSISFVIGRARVTPIKAVTIVRLELAAAVLGTKLGQFGKNELDWEVDETTYWSDSMSVLQYINNKSRRFQTYVANRIATIHEASDPCEWRHIDGKENPADIASRGLKPYQIDKAGLWLNGPRFLEKSKEDWPLAKPIRGPSSTDPELRKDLLVYNTQVKMDGASNQLLRRYSSYIKLLKSTAWLMRYKQYLKNKVAQRNDEQWEDVTCGALTPLDMEKAELAVVRLVQEENFKEQMEVLNDHESLNGELEYKPKRELKRSEQLKSMQQLNPVLVNGVLRVGGRLERSCLPLAARHPIILPSDHHVTTLIIDHYHKLEGHSGTLHVLHAIREKYWILRGQSAVRRVLNRCIPCRRWKSRVGEQMMAALPQERVTPGAKAFESTGTDCFGPLMVKRGRSQEKRYGVIFSCMATRAIHIEVLCSLETNSFINALMRFISRRGRPRKILSDNAGNYVGAERELREAIQRWNSVQIHEQMLQQNIEWKFAVPLASHQSGVWERMIRSVRKIMRSLVGEKLLTDEALLTLLAQVESILNGRPICPLSDNPDDLGTLTPNMLLLGGCNPCIPTDVFIKQDGYRKSWRQVQLISDQFWKKWLKEYLPTLQIRQKWLKINRNFQAGDLVLVVDQRTKRGFWPLGRVEEVYPDSGGLVRSARVRTAESILVRDIRKLCLLEGV